MKCEHFSGWALRCNHSRDLGEVKVDWDGGADVSPSFHCLPKVQPPLQVHMRSFHHDWHHSAVSFHCGTLEQFFEFSKSEKIQQYHDFLTFITQFAYILEHFLEWTETFNSLSKLCTKIVPFAKLWEWAPTIQAPAGSVRRRMKSNLTIWVATIVAWCWLPSTYAATLPITRVTACPRYASATVVICERSWNETSSGDKQLWWVG